MIYNFYIIKNGGVCIFYKVYKHLRDNLSVGGDPQSVTGFLTAMSMFSNHALRDSVKKLATEHYKFFFDSDDKFIFVFLADDSHDDADLLEKLETIKKILYGRLSEDSIKHSSGNITYFDALSKPVASVLNVS